MYSRHSSLEILKLIFSPRWIESLNVLQTLYVAILLFLLRPLELVPLALLLSLQLLLEERKEKKLNQEREKLEGKFLDLKRENRRKEKEGELLGEEVLEEERLSILVVALRGRRG